MTAHPPAHPDPVPETDSLRAAANRRIFTFVAVFTLLLVGALWLVLREEKRRSTLVIPPAIPAAPAPGLPAPAARPAEPAAPAGAPRPPTSPALEQSAQMEEALAAYREASGHLVAKRFEQAEAAALAALRAYPKMAGAQRILGLIYLQQGNLDRSIAVFEASLRNEPFHPDALTNLAFAYLQARNPGLAMELIETCRRLHPDYKPALLQEGIMLLSQPGSERAVEVLREAVEAFPNLAGPRNNLAIALSRIGDRAGAREQLEKLLEMDPLNFSALYNVGALYAQETNAPAAIPWLRRAMEQMSPAQFRSYLNDPDLAPIRESPEYRQFLQELEPVFPGPKPGN